MTETEARWDDPLAGPRPPRQGPPMRYGEPLTQVLFMVPREVLEWLWMEAEKRDAQAGTRRRWTASRVGVPYLCDAAGMGHLVPEEDR